MQQAIFNVGLSFNEGIQYERQESSNYNNRPTCIGSYLQVASKVCNFSHSFFKQPEW